MTIRRCRRRRRTYCRRSNRNEDDDDKCQRRRDVAQIYDTQYKRRVHERFFNSNESRFVLFLYFQTRLLSI